MQSSPLRPSISSQSTREAAEVVYGELLVNKLLVTGSSKGVDIELFSGLTSPPMDCQQFTAKLKKVTSWQDLGPILPRTLADWEGEA
jgi:hypothetical protein